MTILSGGFIVTSLLWGTALSKLIDGRVRPAALTLFLGGVFSLFGVIHSPLPSSPIVPPNEALRLVASENRSQATLSQTPYHWAVAYAVAGLAVLFIGRVGTPPTGRHDDESPTLSR